MLGGNGAGKTTTLRAVSNLLHAERGEVTKGRSTWASVVEADPERSVKARGIPGDGRRHCSGHLTIEENLMTAPRGTDPGRRGDAGKVYDYFPRLKTRRSGQAGYTRAASSRCARSVAR